MLRDQAEETMDMEVLDEAEIEDLNHRLLFPLCTRHPYDHNHIICTSHGESFHIIVFQKIDAHLFTVVNGIPEI